MHTDARELPNDSVIEGDLCIIGAGAAGISIALEWLNTPFKVILLEGGGFDYDEKVQDLYSGKTSGQKYFPLKSTRLHYFGGTTGHWAGYCSTFDEIDFEKRDWVPHSGWPINRADLDSFYARAHKVLELGPYQYDWKYWQKQNSQMQPLMKDESVVWNKVWQFSPPTRFGTKYRDAIVNSKTVHLYTYANVVDIIANENVSEIKNVVAKNYTGKQYTVKAKHYILACNSIQNARLLLASKKQAPKGLGNDNDNVGRYFMEHLEIKSAELWFPKKHPLKLYVFNNRNPRCELAITKAGQQKYSILNGTSALTDLQLAKQMKPTIEVWSSDDPQKNDADVYSSFNKAREAAKSNSSNNLVKNSYQLATRIEQAPNPDSRVTLDNDLDSLGVPRIKLNWVLTPLEKHSIRKIYELIGQQIGRAGDGRVRMMEYLRDPDDDSWPEFTGGAWHHMGTTRMSADPKNGVVDANCKVHGISNLHIAGASCYVTAGAPNPTLTLVALSLRLSDKMKTYYI